MTPEEYEAQKLAELVAAGAPHGLSAHEVEAARATGTPLARFAALKAVPIVHGARSVPDVIAAMNVASAAQEKAEDEAFARRVAEAALVIAAEREAAR